MDGDAGEWQQSGSEIAPPNGRNKAPASNNGRPMTPTVIGKNSHSTSDDTHEYNTESQPSLRSKGNPSPRNAPSYRLRQPVGEYIGIEQRLAVEPPVTKTTLSELDVNKIVNNPKLRHDINFDADLHFRPNLDGEKGRRKAQRANMFWETMNRQLQSFLVDREQFERENGNEEWALPVALTAIRGILETLVPQRDRESVEETFNVELLMQQFRRGVADMAKLANWLSQLLKCHCAPMRDKWVDEMVTQLSNGDRNHDVALLVQGMKNLLAVLEAMKLDVANHQIRCLRPILIDDTVQFEQKFFMKKIAHRRVDVAGAHVWFKSASSLPDMTGQGVPGRSQDNTWDFMKALVHLTLPSKAAELVPHTFLFDEERLVKLRSDMTDLINLEICMDFCRTWQTRNKSQTSHGALVRRGVTSTVSFIPSPYEIAESPLGAAVYSSPTIPLPQDFAAVRFKPMSLQPLTPFKESQSKRHSWNSDIDDERVDTPAFSSPRSSPLSAPSLPETGPATPFYLSRQYKNSPSETRASLRAILASSASSEKWSILSSALALEILHSTNTSLAHLPTFETLLATRLSETDSTFYRDAESRVLSQLSPTLQKLVETYSSYTNLQIFEATTASKSMPIHTPLSQDTTKVEITDFATRIAHIGILHWRVWAELAYLVDPDVIPDAHEETRVRAERARSMP